MTHPFLSHDGIVAFAHRGGAEEAPENTMRAFQSAVDMGFAYLETDAYCTKDGVVLSFHDDSLDRVTDQSGPIASLDYHNVKSAKVAGTDPIPLMAEVLMSWPEVKINIDPKHDEVVGPLIKLIRDLDVLDRICIGSFSDRRIRRFRDAFGPGLCTSMGPIEVSRLKAAASLGIPAGRFDAACVQVPPRQSGLPLVTGSFVARAEKLGLQVHVWTIDDRDEMVRLLDLGVHGMMTDRPRVLKDVLVKRGQWGG